MKDGQTLGGVKEGKATGVVKERKDGKEKKMGKTTGETTGRFEFHWGFYFT